MAPSINPWKDLGLAYRDLYEDQHEAIIFPPYARSPAGKAIVEWGELKCRLCNRYFESGAAAIRRHLKAFHRIEVERARPGTGQQSQKLEMRAFYADMYRYHKKFEDYDTNGGEKPTFNTIGPEESRFPRKGCTEASEGGRLKAIGRRDHKRKRVSSRAERSATGDDEEQSSDSWDSDVYVWPPRPREEEDGVDYGGETTRIYINGKRRRLGEGCVYVTNMPEGGLPAPPCDLTEEQWKAFGIRHWLEYLDEKHRARAEQEKSQETQETTTALTVS